MMVSFTTFSQSETTAKSRIDSLKDIKDSFFCRIEGSEIPSAKDDSAGFANKALFCHMKPSKNDMMAAEITQNDYNDIMNYIGKGKMTLVYYSFSSDNPYSIGIQNIYQESVEKTEIRRTFSFSSSFLLGPIIGEMLKNVNSLNRRCHLQRTNGPVLPGN